jgi:hypothetical protein
MKKKSDLIIELALTKSALNTAIEKITKLQNKMTNIKELLDDDFWNDDGIYENYKETIKKIIERA